MELDFATVRRALREQCHAVSRVLLALPADGFRRPTRLQPWDVLHLAAHLYRDMERVPLALEVPAPAGEADSDVVTYWYYDRAENAARTQARADLIVAEFGDGGSLARAFDAVQEKAVSLLDHTDPDVVVRTWRPVMRVDHFAATRVVEVTIHALDLASALEQPPEVDDAAVTLTSDVLGGLLGAQLPAGLQWDRITWIEKASGRLPLTAGERKALGRRASAFPLLA